jgi:hypothetical protein
MVTQLMQTPNAENAQELQADMRKFKRAQSGRFMNPIKKAPRTVPFNILIIRRDYTRRSTIIF